MLARRSFLVGIAASLVAAPAVLRLPLEMRLRGVPLVTDASIVAYLMEQLDKAPLFYFGAPDDCYRRFAKE